MSLDPEFDSSFTENSREARNYVKFYRQWMRNNFKSEQQGIEVGEYQDFMIIICPGQPKTEVRRKVTDADKQQYRQEWAAYEEGKEHQISGTPIELLPGINASRSDALKAMYIYTIEQMANLADVAMYKVGMDANSLRQRANDFLSKGNAELTALKQRNEQLEQRLAELEKKMQAPRGRPKKVT